MHGVFKSHPQRVRSSGSCLGEAGTVPCACHNEAKMLPAEHETMDAAGGARGGCIAAWEVGHVEDEHEGSAEDFGG